MQQLDITRTRIYRKKDMLHRALNHFQQCAVRVKPHQEGQRREEEETH